MYLKKCQRCGCFYEAVDDVCASCKTRDLKDISKLKLYFEENNDTTNSLQNLSLNTGISVNNLTRYLSTSSFNDYAKEFKF